MHLWRWGGLWLGALLIPLSSGANDDSVWSAALKHTNDHRFSVLFDQQDENAYADTNITSSIQWCKANGITKVYLESFRMGSQVPQQRLVFARDRFRAAGFEVSGAVTTTRFGMLAETNQTLACYTSPESQNQLIDIFASAARIFDRLIIDDFLFTECTCSLCVVSIFNQEIQVGSRLFATGSDWFGFRRELMFRVSKHVILDSARRGNPGTQITIKFPKWYDNYHLRGYDVVRQSKIFDQTWAGTETRDPCSRNDWGQTPQYGAYFITRWLSKISGTKMGGGWFDWLETSPATYVEQARQTVLAGARESVLFCYGGLQLTNSPNPCASPPFSDSTANMARLRANLPELWAVARGVRSRTPVGIAAYKPVNSSPIYPNETEIFSWVGMLGLPLDPCHKFPTNAAAAFFSTHGLTDRSFTREFAAFVRSGKPVLITDRLQEQLHANFGDHLPPLAATNVTVLPVGKAMNNAVSLFSIPQVDLDAIRKPLLGALGFSLSAPAQVAIYPFSDMSCVIENFNDLPVTVTFDGKDLSIPARGWHLNFIGGAVAAAHGSNR